MRHLKETQHKRCYVTFDNKKLYDGRGTNLEFILPARKTRGKATSASRKVNIKEAKANDRGRSKISKSKNMRVQITTTIY